MLTGLKQDSRAGKSSRLSLRVRGRLKSIILQVLVILAFAVFVHWVIGNAASNLTRLNIASGFAFLDMRAGISIPDSLIPYSADSSYRTALLSGLVNTVFMSLLCIVVASVIGLLIALGRLSHNWLLQKLCLTYVEIFRNIPPLLVILFWYFGVLQQVLPPVRESITLPFHIFINQRGIYFPWPDGSGLDIPRWHTFNITGGASLSPEFLALFLSLSLYTAALISETIRAGITGVDHELKEAGASLGLRSGLVTRLITLPLAMRIIIPPLASQYMNLVKNTSLGVAIGYSELMRIGNTVLNQTNQSIEVVIIWMVVYLGLSLLVSVLMNWLNHKMTLVDR